MRLGTVIGLIVVVGCRGGNGDTESTEPVVTIEPSVVATTSSTTSSSTSTTLPPTTTTLPPTTSTTENASLQRQPLLDEAAAAGWGEYEDPLGWSSGSPDPSKASPCPF